MMHTVHVRVEVKNASITRKFIKNEAVIFCKLKCTTQFTSLKQSELQKLQPPNLSGSVDKQTISLPWPPRTRPMKVFVGKCEGMPKDQYYSGFFKLSLQPVDCREHLFVLYIRTKRMNLLLSTNEAFSLHQTNILINFSFVLKQPDQILGY